MRINKAFLAMLILSLLISRFSSPAHGQTAGKLDTAAIDKALGKSGVMMAGDVYRVALPRTDLRALRDHAIDITSLHNHLMNGTPVLYFMHFWADETPDKVANGLKAALEAMKK